MARAKANKRFPKTGELLAPAGDMERALAALRFGADAVFIGAKAYSLRSQASNFFMRDIKQLCAKAHAAGKKVYVTANAVCHNALVKGIGKFMRELTGTGVDALIVADPFVIDHVAKNHPRTEMHLSTQQSVTNSAAARFWRRNGIARVVLAREVTITELKRTAAALNGEVELEYFVHGAVCISFSGRCTMSNNWSLRDANVGGCAQSCRWLFDLRQDDGQKPLSDAFTMSPRDMMLVGDLGKLLDIGVASFKIEGRMRSLNYVTAVVKNYRAAIDLWRSRRRRLGPQVARALAYAQNRRVGRAHSRKNPGISEMLYGEQPATAQQTFAFVVVGRKNGLLAVDGRNWFAPGQKFVVDGPKTSLRGLRLKALYDAGMNPIPAANVPKRTYYLDFGKSATKLRAGDVGRIE